MEKHTKTTTNKQANNAQEQRRKLHEQLVLTELRYFNQTRKELDKLRKMDIKPVSTHTLLHMEKTVHAIETALQHTGRLPEGDVRLKMLRMRYWEYGKSSTRIMMDIHVAKSTYYKWNKEFVKLVGELMGMAI